MEVDQMEVDPQQSELAESMRMVMNASHVVLRIVENVVEHYREKLFTVGTRTRQGDLLSFLNLRFVNRTFDTAVRIAMRKEFRHITVDIDDYYLRCNKFIIGKHQKVAQNQQRRRENRENQENPDDSESDEEMPADEQLPSEDLHDVVFLKRFLTWLTEKFDPAVERFKIFDSWSFKPCTLPASWNKLTVFNSMHPDMEYCECQQCIRTAQTCHKYFGPMSFQMAQDALLDQQISFGAISCTDAFLADIAIEYSKSGRFEADKFSSEFGGIRCDELNLAVQTITYSDEEPKPQPLQVIQLLIRLWKVKTVQFEIVKVLENEYYMSRCVWEQSPAFEHAHFASFVADDFDEEHHVLPYRIAGTLDDGLREECLPIFDIRVDFADNSGRMSSTLSIVSAMSQSHPTNSDLYEWPNLGRIAFHMFKTKRFLFIQTGVVDFRGTLGTANWLKYTIRSIMRYTWGPRHQMNVDTGKTVYWIHFLEEVLPESMAKVWNEHLEELLTLNFPTLDVFMNTSDAFEKCENRTIATYCDVKRPDVEQFPGNTHYLSFYDPVRNNHTHIKFIQVK